MTGLELALLGLAAVAAGAVNALAGGGTLITFPALTMLGVPALAANVTNTVALCPGYLGGVLAQSRDLRGQQSRLILLVPAAVAGGLAGGALLLATGEKSFRMLVPYLILLASAALALQQPLRDWIARRRGASGADSSSGVMSVPLVGLAAVYGGYFGAGLSVIVLAMLGLLHHESLTRLNAVKQVVSLVVNVAAALFFVFSSQVVWPAAAVMAVSALAGGALGGRLGGRIRPSALRWIVVTTGVVVGLVYLAV